MDLSWFKSWDLAVAIAGASWLISLAQAWLMRNQNDASVYSFIIGVLQSIEAKDAREIVYGHHKNRVVDWRDKDSRAARLVASTFDIVATISGKSRWCRKKLIQGWGPQILKCWIATKSYIDDRRRSEGINDLFGDFQHLADATREVVDEKRLKWGD